MELKVNKEAGQELVKGEFENALAKIKENANNGLDITEILFPKDIFRKCRTMLNEHMKEHNINFGWMDLGGIMSLDYGTHRMMKFRLKQ